MPSLVYVPKRSRNTDFSIIRKDPEMAVLNETAKTVRTFVYNVSVETFLPVDPHRLEDMPSQKWSVLASTIEQTRDRMLDAQKEAFKILREQVCPAAIVNTARAS